MLITLIKNHFPFQQSIKNSKSISKVSNYETWNHFWIFLFSKEGKSWHDILFRNNNLINIQRKGVGQINKYKGAKNSIESVSKIYFNLQTIFIHILPIQSFFFFATFKSNCYIKKKRKKKKKIACCYITILIIGFYVII